MAQFRPGPVVAGAPRTASATIPASTWLPEFAADKERPKIQGRLVTFRHARRPDVKPNVIAQNPFSVPFGRVKTSAENCRPFLFR